MVAVRDRLRVHDVRLRRGRIAARVGREHVQRVEVGVGRVRLRDGCVVAGGQMRHEAVVRRDAHIVRQPRDHAAGRTLPAGGLVRVVPAKLGDRHDADAAADDDQCQRCRHQQHGQPAPQQLRAPIGVEQAEPVRAVDHGQDQDQPRQRVVVKRLAPQEAPGVEELFGQQRQGKQRVARPEGQQPQRHDEEGERARLDRGREEHVDGVPGLGDDVDDRRRDRRAERAVLVAVGEAVPGREVRDDHRGRHHVHRQAADDHGGDQPPRAAALCQAQQAEHRDEQAQVLADEQQQTAPEQQLAIVAAVERVDRQRGQGRREGDLMEVEVDQRLDRPAEAVCPCDQHRDALAGAPPGESVDDRDRRRDEYRLRDQQHEGVVPEPVQRR